MEVAGTYSIEGKPNMPNVEGSPYTGTATITRVGTNCFTIEWKLDDGQTRSGMFTMSGNTLGGRWQSGKRSGLFKGTAGHDGHIGLWWGIGDTEKHITDYEEILTRK